LHEPRTPFLTDALTLALTSRPCWLRRSILTQVRQPEHHLRHRLEFLAPIVCEAHLGCGWIALVGAVGDMGVILTDELPPMMRACSCCATPLALCSDRSSDGCSPHCFRIWCFWWPSVLVERVYRGRFRNRIVTLRLWSMFVHRCLQNALSWVAVRGLLLARYSMWVSTVLPLRSTRWDILRARSPAGRRVCASFSASVQSYKSRCIYIHFVHYLCIHVRVHLFLVFGLRFS
jgi:hypothetical protein